MPLYEYVCSACGRRAELLIRNARERPACPGCSSRNMVRQLSTFAAHMGGAKCPAADSCRTDTCPGRSKCPLS
jgi:putative FmdB family regulatory protein